MNILIASVPSDGGDGLAVQTQVLAYCPSAITAVVYYTNMSDAIAYAVANGYTLIARNVNDFAASYAQAAIAALSGIGIVWAHGSNSHVLESNPPALVMNAIGAGYGTAGLNAGSYGPALDFFVNGASSESQACGIVAGAMGQALINNPTKTFEIVRTAMQQSCPNYPTPAADGGYGAIDLTLVQSRIILPIDDDPDEVVQVPFGAMLY